MRRISAGLAGGLSNVQNSPFAGQVAANAAGGAFAAHNKSDETAINHALKLRQIEQRRPHRNSYRYCYQSSMESTARRRCSICRSLSAWLMAVSSLLLCAANAPPAAFAATCPANGEFCTFERRGEAALIRRMLSGARPSVPQGLGVRSANRRLMAHSRGGRRLAHRALRRVCRGSSREGSWFSSCYAWPMPPCPSGVPPGRTPPAPIDAPPAAGANAELAAVPSSADRMP